MVVHLSRNSVVLGFDFDSSQFSDWPFHDRSFLKSIRSIYLACDFAQYLDWRGQQTSYMKGNWQLCYYISKCNGPRILEPKCRLTGLDGTLQRTCSRERAVPLRGEAETGAPFDSLFWSPFNNVITNNLKLCLFAFFVDLSRLKSWKINVRSYATPLVTKELKLTWSHVRRVLPSMTLRSIAGFHRVLWLRPMLTRWTHERWPTLIVYWKQLGDRVI